MSKILSSGNGLKRESFLKQGDKIINEIETVENTLYLWSE